MSDKFTNDRSNEADTLGSSAAKYTPTDADLPLNVKAVVFDDDGVISFKNDPSTAITAFPVVRGMPIPFVPLRITAMTGPANCFLIY